MAKLQNDWIDSYMQFVDNSEPPILYKKWIAISVLAGALQRKCWMDWGYIRLYPNMYIVLVGPSGKCRKGTAMGPGMDFLKGLGVKMAAESITREALIRELKNSTSNNISQDGRIVLDHCSLTIYSQELTVFLGYNNQALMSDLADWYDCRESWTYRTKSSGTDEIKGVYVNLIGATTPELIQSTLPRDAVGGGLTSRIIFIFEDQKHKTISFPFLSRADLEMKETLQRRLEEIHMRSGQFRFTEPFMERWGAWYPTQDKNTIVPANYFFGYIERRPTHMFKLCMIMSASARDDMVITEVEFDRALDLLVETERKMEGTFRGVGQHQYAAVTERIIQFIRKRGPVQIDEILRTFYSDVDSKALTGILDSLAGMKCIALDYTQGGPPRVIFRGPDYTEPPKGVLTPNGIVSLPPEMQIDKKG